MPTTNPLDPAFGSEALNPDRLIAGDPLGPTTEKVTLTDISSTGALVRGTVLGQVTADSKFGICLNGSADGSEVARAILAKDADPSSGDVEAMIFRTGQFNQDRLTFGTGTTIANSRESLANQGILLVDPTAAP